MKKKREIDNDPKIYDLFKNNPYQFNKEMQLIIHSTVPELRYDFDDVWFDVFIKLYKKKETIKEKGIINYAITAYSRTYYNYQQKKLKPKHNHISVSLDEIQFHCIIDAGYDERGIGNTYHTFDDISFKRKVHNLAEPPFNIDLIEYNPLKR